MLGILMGALAIYSMISRRNWPSPIILLASLGSLVLVTLIWIDVFRAAQQWQVSPADFVGTGIVVVLAGSLLAAGSALSSLRRRY